MRFKHTLIAAVLSLGMWRGAGTATPVDVDGDQQTGAPELLDLAASWKGPASPPADLSIPPDQAPNTGDGEKQVFSDRELIIRGTSGNQSAELRLQTLGVQDLLRMISEPFGAAGGGGFRSRLSMFTKLNTATAPVETVKIVSSGIGHNMNATMTLTGDAPLLQMIGSRASPWSAAVTIGYTPPGSTNPAEFNQLRFQMYSSPTGGNINLFKAGATTPTVDIDGSIGRIQCLSSDFTPKISLEGETGRILGQTFRVGNDGNITLFKTGASTPTIDLDGAQSRIRLVPFGDKARIQLDGGGGAAGITLNHDDINASPAGAVRLRVVGNERVEIISAGGGGQIKLYPSATTTNLTPDQIAALVSIRMDGNNGRVTSKSVQITGGSDFSENFDMSCEESSEPGMVVAIDSANPGHLCLARTAYDKKVAGIVSGAGGVAPGMLMGHAGTLADGKHPVALTGRVYCWVDASNGAVEPGDLLTTSDTPGHAMKVTDHAKAQGAIIGKAMTGLAEGAGLVLVLVTLQ
ncbi:MAG: hypothetical protein GHCLOJNM_01862 [bacterium]|nr:hypothetical protein [bacterium]